MVWRGHSLFQDAELFTLLEAQVSIVRGLIAMQGNNQVVCKNRRCQGEPAWNRLRAWGSRGTGQQAKSSSTEQRVDEKEVEANQEGSTGLVFQALLVEVTLQWGGWGIGALISDQWISNLRAIPDGQLCGGE